MIEPPNEVRNFVHRRIIAAGKAFLTGGPVGAAGAFVAAGGAGSVAPDRLCDAVGRPTAAGIAVGVNCSPAAAVPRTTPRTSATSACIWPLRQDPVTCQCKVFGG